MSDDFIRLVPADLHWQPTEQAAAAAVAYVAQLFTGPGDRVEKVEYEFYDWVTIIDAGEATSQVMCTHCGADIGADWYFELFELNAVTDDLMVTVPCCNERVSMVTLRYDSPIGFGRFEVSAMNPTRADYELNEQELSVVAELLGHPVVQILAHY